MGEILDMAQHKARKLDCQGEVVDLRSHFASGPETPERSVRATEAARALSVCVNLMRAEFGDRFTLECLAGEVFVLKFGGKK